MTYFQGPGVDAQNGKSAYVTFQQEQKVAEVIRLVGPNFTGTTIDSSFWGTTLVGSGGVTQATGAVTLATNSGGATINSAATLTSARKGRFMFVHPNQFRAAIILPDTGTANNIRRWGAYDANEGFGFILDGSTFGVFRRAGGSENVTSSGSFNGPGGASYSLNTNVHFYEIVYYVARADFYIDGVLYHTMTPTTARLVNGLTNPITLSTINSGGSSTNVTMDCWNASILRLGAVTPRDQYARISTNTTTVLKRGAGTLHAVVINTKGSGSNTATIYDNTSASGTILAVVDTTSSYNAVGYQADFFTGLTVVTATGSAPDMTVLFD